MNTYQRKHVIWKFDNINIWKESVTSGRHPPPPPDMYPRTLTPRTCIRTYLLRLTSWILTPWTLTPKTHNPRSHISPRTKHPFFHQLLLPTINKNFRNLLDFNGERGLCPTSNDLVMNVKTGSLPATPAVPLSPHPWCSLNDTRPT